MMVTEAPRPEMGLGGSHVVADQSEVTAFLAKPETYGSGVENVERIDTHGAMVFLAGEHAYKVKRAVRFPYMDFSTLALRQHACQQEVIVNRRTAPDLYQGAVPIIRGADGGLSLGEKGSGEKGGGDGDVVEWLVVMKRFAQEQLFDRLAQAGALTPELMRALADEIAAFHAAAETLSSMTTGQGGAAAIGAVIEENALEFAERPDLFPVVAAEAYTQSARAALSRIAVLLDQRLAEGFVRRCHGDLHLRNICLIEGRPTLFDAIEFNDAIACIDVLNDLAFLLMDLEHRGLRPYANLVLNRYLQHSGEITSLAALPLFLSLRAAIRAKVSASAEANLTDAAEKRTLRVEIQRYFDAAVAYLAPPPARLIAVGGLSGSGKTSLARALAPKIGAAPGALHLRSDVLRKALLGVDELTPLPQDAYTPENSARVYNTLLSQARTILTAGHSVVVDAVYSNPARRQAIEAVARDVGVRFTGLWLRAPEDILVDRVTERSGDASDATAAVVQQQLLRDPGVLSWRQLDARGPLRAVTVAAEQALAF